MAHITDNRILETSVTAGTGAIALDGAVTGYRRLSAKLAIGDTCHYLIQTLDAVGRPTGEYEYGRGTYSALNTLARTTVVGSSNADALVAFSAATKEVSLAAIAPTTDQLRADWRAMLGVPDSDMTNRLINPEFSNNARNAGTISTNDGFPADRWALMNTSAGTNISAGISATAPAGYRKSLRLAVPTALATPTGTNLYGFYQGVEGLNVADLFWGTVFALPITISFSVRSNVLGTFSCAVENSALNRTYNAPFTVNAINTDERKTITIPGDTGGVWAADTSAGLWVVITLAAGPTAKIAGGAWTASPNTGITGQSNFLASTANVIYFTGFQLEKGSTASPFRRRFPPLEDLLCGRYYETGAESMMGYGVATSSDGRMVRWRYPKRATPTINFTTTLASNCAPADMREPSVDGALWFATVTSAGGYHFAGTWSADAELA